MVKILFCLCSVLLPQLVLAQLPIPRPAQQDTICIYFDIGVSAIGQPAQVTIDSLVYFDILQPGKKVGIIGYADYLGSEESNIGLSETRANNVKMYLESLGIKQADIELVVGKGEVKRTTLNGTAGYQEDRRVDIIPGGFKPSEPVTPVTPQKPPTKQIDLSTAKKDETIKLENIHFVGGSHQWLEHSIPALQSLLDALKKNHKVRVRIEGHVCCLLPEEVDGIDYETGTSNLSHTRAKSVYDYLIENGIPAARLEHRGFGRSRPLRNPERTEYDRTTNRRVEIRILEN